MKPMTKRALLAALLLSAIAIGAGPVAAQSETLTYKGRTIKGSPDGRGNAMFFETIKRAIDMAETLPPRQRELAAMVTDLRYEPPTAGARDITDSIIGVYTVGADWKVPGYISFRRNPAMSSALDYLQSLVGNAGYDVWRLRRLEAQRKNNKGEDTYYANLMAKKDPDLNVLAECAQLNDQMAVLKAVDADPRRIDNLSKTINNRNCHGKKPPY